MSELRKGQKVQVTFVGEYDGPCANGGHYITHRCQPPAGKGGSFTAQFHLGPDAIVESFEDLRQGDVVLDADGVWLYRHLNGWMPFGTDDAKPDEWATRPFKLHIRSGEVIS